MDVVLTNARVVDGTGKDPEVADVGLGDGVIEAVGDLRAEQARTEVIDLDGLVLCPGFIDAHTHYDAQITWEGSLAPSSWHGVTTVIIGNCGFGIAPARPAHRELLIRTLENVEGMSYTALSEGIDWQFESFGEYLDMIEARPKRCNVGVLVGHTPVRVYVMGDEAVKRPATPAEVEEERSVVEGALNAGAVGFSSSKTDVHVGADGGPVPSYRATNEEIKHLARALPRVGHGVFQFTWGPEFWLTELLEVSRDISPRPVVLTALLDGFDQPLRGLTNDEVLAELDRDGGDVWPQVSCRPLVFQMTLEDPFILAQGRTAFQEVLARPREERAALYRDNGWRERAKGQLGADWADRWTRTTVQETRVHEEIRNGPTVASLAEDRGMDAFDLVVELALADDLATRFRIVLYNYDDVAVGRLLKHPRTLISLSDAGAHSSQLCDANFGTFLLEKWVRELGVLTLPEAVHQLTQVPARLFGLDRRGVIRPGYRADLVAFDPATVGSTEVERVWDQPGGADRLVAYSHGIEAVWIGGTQTRAGGVDLVDSNPGRLIRGGQASREM